MIDPANAPEPPDGSTVVVIEWDGDRKVIWRDDEGNASGHPADHWFDDVNGDPMGWEQFLKYAVAVHHVEPRPFATSTP